MNTKQFTFHSLSSDLTMSFDGVLISLEQGTYKVVGYPKLSKKLETVAQFPITLVGYSVEILPQK